ncbi:MAG TPA: FmdB family zinc ribbon protein [bacterium]
MFCHPCIPAPPLLFLKEMPTYEYECTKCHHHLEELQKMTDKPLIKCPVCGGILRRLISGGSGLIFKGSGFYATDYKKTNSVSHESQKKDNHSKPGEGKKDPVSSKDPGGVKKEKASAPKPAKASES